MKKSKSKQALYDNLVRYPFHNAYRLSDLDDSYWRFTDYYVGSEDKSSSSVIMRYSKFETPIYINIVPEININVLNMWRKLIPDLENKFYLHANSEVVDLLKTEFTVEQNIKSFRMGMTFSNHKELLESDYIIRTVRPDEIAEVHTFLNEHYPENWFDHELLNSGKFKVILKENKWLAFGGIHTCSDQYRIAALGSIAVHRDFRGMGLGELITSSICADLFKSCDYIALNVKSDNYSAIRCYEKIGFRKIIEYSEVLLRVRT